MTQNNKVVWSEGLFLRPQHMQQQERYFERLVRTSTGGLRPFAYGLTQLEIDADLLKLGKFSNIRPAIPFAMVASSCCSRQQPIPQRSLAIDTV